MNDLLKILIEYSEQEKIFDHDAIKKIIKIVTDIDDTNELVEIINIQKYIGEGFKRLIGNASYDFDNKTIHISTQNILFDAYSRLNSYNEYNYTTTIEDTYFINFIYIQKILHELEHARQHKIETTNQDMEGHLIRLSRDRKTTSASYPYKPTERLAQIKAWERVCNISLKLQDTYPNLFKYFIECKNNAIEEGYYNHITGEYIPEGPTYKYVNIAENAREIKMKPVFKNIEELEQTFTDTEVRLIYGLPVSQAEHFYHSIKR